MEQEILKMMDEIKEMRYNKESVNRRYNSLLERFILNYDPELLPLMRELIEIEKEFWYD